MTKEDALIVLEKYEVHSCGVCLQDEWRPHSIDAEDVMKFAIEAVKQPERKKGKWITEPYDIESDVWAHRCSNCLKVAMLGGNDINLNYCPNCGSYNGGEQDAEH